MPDLKKTLCHPKLDLQPDGKRSINWLEPVKVHKTQKNWAQKTPKICKLLHCVAGIYNSFEIVKYVAACCSVLQRITAYCSVLQRVAVCCSVLQRVAACCSVLQRVAACCSVSQGCMISSNSDWADFFAVQYSRDFAPSCPSGPIGTRTTHQTWKSQCWTSTCLRSQTSTVPECRMGRLRWVGSLKL